MKTVNIIDYFCYLRKWRCRWELHPRMGVLQTPALLLGYGTEEAISIGNGQRKANVVEKESKVSEESKDQSART